MCGTAALHLGPETTGYPDWKASPKDGVRGIGWRYHQFCNDADGHTCLMWRDTMLQKATGALLNSRKSKAPAVGWWSTSTDTLNISYNAEIKILGVTFTCIIEHSMNKSWATATGKLRAQARDTYERDLSLLRRIHYVQAYLLAKIWHKAQVFPAHTTCTGQLTTTIAWYIWKWATFRLPILTLQKPTR